MTGEYEGPPILIYGDSDYAGDISDRKSTSGVIIYVYGFPIFWMSKKQTCICLSSSEAEYVCVCEAGKFAIWLLRFLKELAQDIPTPVPIYEDNQSTITMVKNPALNHGRTKHIDVRYHWIRQQVQQNTLKLVYCPSTKQLADLLSKPVKVAVLTQLMQLGFMGNPQHHH